MLCKCDVARQNVLKSSSAVLWPAFALRHLFNETRMVQKYTRSPRKSWARARRTPFALIARIQTALRNNSRRRKTSGRSPWQPTLAETAKQGAIRGIIARPLAAPESSALNNNGKMEIRRASPDRALTYFSFNLHPRWDGASRVFNRRPVGAS